MFITLAWKNEKRNELGAKQTWIQILALPIRSCVIWIMSLDHSQPHG